jgi:hypothetical protein
VVGDLVAGATVGLVSGAIANAAKPPVVVEAAPSPYPPPGPTRPLKRPQTMPPVRRRRRKPLRTARKPPPPSVPVPSKLASVTTTPAPPAPAPGADPPVSGPTPGALPGTRFAYGARFILPPDDCKLTQRGPIAFEQCGVDWLKPVMQGRTAYYIAVPSPG